MSGELPDDIVQSIAISNAKSIGEQPAMLASQPADESLAGPRGEDNHVRLKGVDLGINSNGQVVVELPDRGSLEILVPGNFDREDVQVLLDPGRGFVFRVRKGR